MSKFEISEPFDDNQPSKKMSRVIRWGPRHELFNTREGEYLSYEEARAEYEQYLIGRDVIECKSSKRRETL